jgi:polygalacturonase
MKRFLGLVLVLLSSSVGQGEIVIDPPKIAPPPQPVFDVRKYGAVGDGATFDTQAIQKAIDACSGSHGSVLISGGKFLTAPLVLKSAMTLFITPDATLLGSTRPEDYPVLIPPKTAASANQRSLLYADQVSDLAIDGGGTIDGQGKLLKMTGREWLRPSLIRIFSSTNVTVRDITLQYPRMWTQVYSECSHLLLDHVNVLAPRGYCINLDGMDVCDCSDTTVRNCTIDSEDDCICLKSHGRQGLKNITVENNLMRHTAANGIKLGTASSGPVEHLRITHNAVQGAAYGGVCIESVDGSAVRDVVVKDLELENVAEPIFVRLANRQPTTELAATPAHKPGSIEDVTIEDVRATQPPAKRTIASTISGIPGARIRGVTIRNCTIEATGGRKSIPENPPEHPGDYPQSNLLGDTPGAAFFVRHADGVVFQNVTVHLLNPDHRPWLATDDADVKTIDSGLDKEGKTGPGPG